MGIWVGELMFAGRITHKVLRWGRNDDGEYTIDDREEVSNLDNADVVSSLSAFGGNYHLPVLDLDIPHKYVPSTTTGHGHLYLDVAIRWEDYQELLHLLARLGIVEPGYVGASINRGHTAVRLPWVKKEDI